MSSAYSCLTCARTFASAAALVTHAQAKAHTAHPGAAAAAMAAAVNLTYLCVNCASFTAFTTAAALRTHVAAKHTPRGPPRPPGPPPAYSALPTPPAHPPKAAVAAAGPRYVCNACPNSKGFATADALRTHKAAKHALTSTPARSAPLQKRTNAPRPGAKQTYSEVDLKVLVKTSS
jgi:hypothetical protein